VNEKLQTLLVEVLQIPPNSIVDSLAMKDVENWDSLKHMELIAAIEETFGLELTFAEIVEMQSVGEIKRVINARGT
jgi:acyl carrier protein